MLTRIADDVWAHERTVKAGVLRLPTRTTIIRLAGDALVMHSPLDIDDATAREINAIGDVRFLVAPNCLHWRFLKAAKERYGAARVLGAPGLEKKVRGLAFEPLPESGYIEGAGDELRVERIQGAPGMTEHVFFHEASRSLIVTDLLFNVHRCQSLVTRLMLRLVGAHEKTAQSRVWRLLVKDRAAAARSVSTLLGWNFERIVVGHGDVVTEAARDLARTALAWMAGGAPRLLGTGSAI